MFILGGLFQGVTSPYLGYICDTSMESPSFDSNPIFCEFPNVFPTNLSGIPPVHDTVLITLILEPDLFLCNLTI